MLPFLLLADAVAPAPDTGLITTLATVAAAGLLALLRIFAKDKAEERRKMIANIAEGAYLITAEVALRTPNTIDDKVAHALGVLKDQLADRGAAPLTAAEESRAKFIWQAMHGAEKLTGAPASVVPR